MGIFMAKIVHIGRLVPNQRNPPGNCLMGHITSQSMGKHYLGPSKPSPSSQLGLGGVENGSFYGKHGPYRRAGSRSKKPTWKMSNGPYHIPIHGEILLGAIKAFSRYHFRSAWVKQMAIFRIKTHTMSVNLFGCLYWNPSFLWAHHLEN